MHRNLSVLFARMKTNRLFVAGSKCDVDSVQISASENYDFFFFLSQKASIHRGQEVWLSFCFMSNLYPVLTRFCSHGFTNCYLWAFNLLLSVQSKVCSSVECFSCDGHFICYFYGWNASLNRKLLTLWFWFFFPRSITKKSFSSVFMSKGFMFLSVRNFITQLFRFFSDDPTEQLLPPLDSWKLWQIFGRVGAFRVLLSVLFGDIFCEKDHFGFNAVQIKALCLFHTP